MLIVCQFCHSKIYSCTEHQTTWIGICFSILLFLIFRIYSIILILLLIPLTQSTIHTCPNCLNTIGVRSFYDILSLTDKVLTFQMFSLGIIITKKQMLGVFIFALFIIVFYLCISSFEILKRSLPDTWNDYTSLCLRDKFLLHPRIHGKCKEKYLYQEISWTGYAIRIDFDERFFSRYRAHMLVKMIENESEEPELQLKFTDSKYSKYKMDILNTTRGDFIRFNATIMFEGSLNNVPILETLEYQKLDKKIFINPHVHNTGRYSTAGKQLEADTSIYSELPSLISDSSKNVKTKETNT